jgi:hypothetical protein
VERRTAMDAEQQQAKKSTRFSKRNLIIAISTGLLLIVATTLWILATINVLHGYWSFILPVLFTVASFAVALYPLLLPAPPTSPQVVVRLIAPSVPPPIKAPIDYQLIALRQIILQLKGYGRPLSIDEFNSVIIRTLRDGENPTFEPLSLSALTDGVNELIKSRELMFDGNNIYIPS